MNLTEEQLEIVDAAREMKGLRVTARAGTGKTTTNKAIALDQPDKKFLYLAFNRRVADEAKATFPKNATVMTAHSLAYRAVGKHFKDRICRSQYKIKAELGDRFAQAYSALGAPPELEQVSLFAALESINTFCASADVEIDDKDHVPDGPYNREHVGALARGMWQAMSDPSDWAPISDDVYLKIWQLAVARGQSHAGKQLAANCILYDEAQDASGAMIDVVRRSGVPLVLTGDQRQCLPGESLITTPNGRVRIDEIRPGSMVISGLGGGHCGAMRVSDVFTKTMDVDLVVITTLGGRTIRTTPDHTHFAEFSTKPGAVDQHFVYLMERADLGFRIGRAYGSPSDRLSGSGFIGRARSEAADRTWVLQVCSTAEKAALQEQILSLQYGIPTVVFKSVGRRIYGDNIAKLFAAIDTRANAHRLLADLDFSADAPHHVPRSMNRSRRNFTTTLCGEYRPGKTRTQHRYSISGSSADDAKLLADAGLPLRTAKKHHGGWRIEGTSVSLGAIRELEKRVGDVLGPIVPLETGRLGSGTALRLMPARNCHSGMLMFVEDEVTRTIVTDEIVSVRRERFTGSVYDLNIDRTHNFIADGVVTHNCIYGWRGAVDAFKLCPQFEELSLTQSWRFGQEIAAPANDILTVLGEFHLIDGRGPSGKVVVNDDSIFPQAIVARTNTGIVTEAVRIVDDGGSIHIVGGHEQIFSWLRAAYELWKNDKTQHPAFTMFRSWEMLKLASGQSIGRNYKPFVTLVESYRMEIPNLLMRLELASVPPEKADTVLSSVHRFKGQEAGYVKIADDFGPFCTPNLKSTGPAFVIDEEEANLAYVAVTRARVQLDLGGFAATLRESLLNARKLLDSQPIVY
jgi:hypothetical protein